MQLVQKVADGGVFSTRLLNRPYRPHTYSHMKWNCPFTHIFLRKPFFFLLFNNTTPKHVTDSEELYIYIFLAGSFHSSWEEEEEKKSHPYNICCGCMLFLSPTLKTYSHATIVTNKRKQYIGLAYYMPATHEKSCFIWT